MNSNARDRRKFVSIAVIATCALVLGVGLSGCCTASQAEPASKASENPTPVPATVEWKSKEVLVSDVELIGDVAIAYRHQGPQLEIIARNLKNGKQLWKDEALGAADALGVDLDIELVKHGGRHYAAYAGTKTGAYGWLTITDISTGEQVKIGKNFEQKTIRGKIKQCTGEITGTKREENRSNLPSRTHPKMDEASKNG